MKAQRMKGNAAMSAQMLAQTFPVRWRTGAISVHTKSDGTFDVVAVSGKWFDAAALAVLVRERGLAQVVEGGGR